VGSEARARLGLAALLGATLLAYLQVFAQGDYPGPVLLGMLLAGGLAAGARRLGAGTLLSLSLSVVSLFWYLSLVFAAPATYYGVPTPGAADEIGRALAHAYGSSEVDFAPVPVRPGYVIALVVALWLATTVGELATFRWRRPLIASFVPLVLFCVALVVGSGTAAPMLIALFLGSLLCYWGLESSHRVRSWGRWIGTWTTQEEDETVSAVGRIARGMGATSIAVALVSPLFLPALGDGLLSWRSGVGSGPGGVSTRLDPLVSIAPRLLRQTNEELFRVRAEGGTYWRLVTLGTFDGEVWAPVGDPYAPLSTGEFDSGVPPETPVRTLEQRVLITGLQGEPLPAATAPSRVIITNPSDRQEDARHHSSSMDLSLEGGVEDGVEYTVVSDAPDLAYGDLVQAPVAQLGIPGGVDPRYFREPAEGIAPEVDDLVDRWTANAGSPFQKLVALQTHFQRFTYSTDPSLVSLSEQTASSDHLATFLTETKAGYCQQFSTAFALLARHLGYPTRVVVGFLPGEQSATRANEWIVRGTDAHAWPEVYFEDYGWIAFEPTPRSDRLPLVPSYTIRGGGTDVDLRTIAREGGGLQPTGPQGRFAVQETRSGGVGSFAAPETDEAPPAPPDPEWPRYFARVAWTVAALLFAFLVAVPALKRWRIRRRYARALTPRDVVAAAFAEFEQEAGELVAARSPAETATSYALRVAGLRRLGESPAVLLATMHDAACYGPRETSETAATEARALTRELKSRLWARASWWERGIRLFSTRGLGLPGRL
jgi:transglutaminase-like putative cysteine protease